GLSDFNNGGGVRAYDVLYDYKASCGAMEMPLVSVRQIYDPARYDELCTRSGVRAEGNWFPAYRHARGSEQPRQKTSRVIQKKSRPGGDPGRETPFRDGTFTCWTQRLDPQ